MNYVHQGTPMSTLFSTVSKFREVAAGKIVYNLPNSSIEVPKILTVTSTLPTPRKGNPGTVKTLFNIHNQVTLDAGLPTQRQAPIVLKLEVSFPLGSTDADREETLLMVGGLCNYADAELQALLKNGVLPKD
jgi:hypothetical protein